MGDDAQRAFGADEQVLQVAACVVFEHGPQHGQHGAVGQHHLQPQGLLAHHAVLHHTVAARIGGQVAPDLARAARTQVHAEEKAGGSGGFLHRLQRGTGLHGEGGSHLVYWVDVVHASQRQRNAAADRHRAAAQACQAALGHHWHAVRVAQGQHA